MESKIDNLPVIGDFINDALMGFQADSAIIYKVQLAVDEACTNVINYAYSGGSGPLIVSLELVGRDVVVTINDKGKPFNPTLIPPPI
jgi:serine/threonine-protein kinase RsbW